MTISKSERKRISKKSIRVFFRPPANCGIPSEDIPVIKPTNDPQDVIDTITDEEFFRVMELLGPPKEPTK